MNDIMLGVVVFLICAVVVIIPFWISDKLKPKTSVKKSTKDELKDIKEGFINPFKQWYNFFAGVITPTHSKEDALKAMKGTAYFVYFVAVLNLVIGLLANMNMVYDAVVLVVLGLLLDKKQSRISAVLLFIYSMFLGAVTLGNFMNKSAGGKNWILAILLILSSFNAILATFKYHMKVKAE